MSPDTFSSPRISSIPAVLTTVKLAEDETASVHRALLTASSDNFAAALTGRFTEAQSNSLSLDDTTIGTFGYYTDWLYSGNLLDGVPAREAGDYGTLFNIYFFGDRYRIPQFKRAVMTRIIKISDEEKTIPAEKCIRTAFESLPENDPLLSWAVDEYVAQWHPGNGDMVDKTSDDVHHDFMVRLINKMAEVTWNETRLEWRARKSPCDYHAHESDESREKCRASSKGRRPSRTLSPPREPILVDSGGLSTGPSSWWRGLKLRFRQKTP